MIFKSLPYLFALLCCCAVSGRADGIGPLASLPPMVRVSDADAEVPVTFDVPRGDMSALLHGGSIVRDMQTGTAAFRFASHAAALHWFDTARPVPPWPTNGAAPLVRLGAEWQCQGPLFGPDGRAWLWAWYTAKPIPVEQMKRTIESACLAPLNREVMLVGAEILWIDKRGRVWLLPYADRDLLLGYDPSTRQWIEHRRPKDFYLLNEPAGAAAFESRSGSLFFPDTGGVNVLQGARWSYQPIRGWNERADSNSPRFGEDSAGSVYVWASCDVPHRLGTDGYWVFNGTDWTNINLLPKVGRVIPRSPRETFLLAGDKLSIVKDGALLTGWDAEQAFDPNLSFKRAYFLAQDAGGTVYLLLRDVQCIDPPIDAAYRVVALPARGKAEDFGEPSGRFFESIIKQLDAPFHPSVQVSAGRFWNVDENEILSGRFGTAQTRVLPKIERLTYLRIEAIDARGRFYLSASGQLWRFDPAAPHLAEAAAGQIPAMRVRTVGASFHDSLGRLWCTWATDDAPLAVFDGGKWQLLKSVSKNGFIAAFPGTNGAMIFEDWNYAFHLYDEEGDVQESSAAELAAKHWERVGKALRFPPLPALDEIGHLIKDAEGNIWWSNWCFGWGVVSGGKAINGSDLPLGIDPKANNAITALIPIGDGRTVMVGDEGGGGGIVTFRDGKLEKVSDLPAKVEREPISRDADGNVWVVRALGEYSSQKIDGAGHLVALHPGQYLFEDSRQGLWFIGDQSNSATPLHRVDAAGLDLQFDAPEGLRSPALSPDGTVWALNDYGLLHIAVQGRSLRKIGQYALPLESQGSLWCDNHGRVWQSRNGGPVLICYATLPIAP